MKEALLIYNPTSGKGQLPGSLSPVLDVFTKAGWLVTVYPTQCKGDAVRAAGTYHPLETGTQLFGGSDSVPLALGGMCRRRWHFKRNCNRADGVVRPTHAGIYSFRLHQ